MVANKTLVFKKIPTDYPVPGEHLVIEDRPLDIESAPENAVVVECQYASFDPYLRGRMRDPSIKSYSPAFNINDPIVNAVAGKVIKSNNPNFKEGDLVKGTMPLAEYAIVEDPKKAMLLKIDNPHNLETGVFLGPLGMPGLTAWSGLFEIGKPKEGETISISSAAGAVGQIVGQVAKKKGLKVIGSVGSDEKLDFIINELGFDAGFNYKKESPFDALKRLAPNGIDIYFENVGGAHLEAALLSINDHGRIPVCGMINEYNIPKDQQKGIKGMMNVVAKKLTMQGFIVAEPNYGPKYYAEHQKTLGEWIVDGSVKTKLHITEGIDKAAEGLVGIFKGENFGKAVLKIR